MFFVPELPNSLIPFIVPVVGVERFFTTLLVTVTFTALLKLYIPSMPPVDVTAVQLNPSIVFPFAVQLVGLVVFIPRHEPDAPLRVIFVIEFPLVVTVVGEPVSMITSVPVPAKGTL